MSRLKYVLFIAANLFLLNAATCQKSDTTIVYLRYGDDADHFRGIVPVSTLDSADFIRMITPPDAGDDRANVREFYKNGKLKFTGKYGRYYNPVGVSTPEGDCVYYYPNGKRQNIVHYANEHKEGDEYLFYPDGTIYCTKKNVVHPGELHSEALNWECYNRKGDMICNEGNGHWITYDGNFNIVIQGTVKDGLFEGDWPGTTGTVDSIKYVYKFKKGVFISGVSYDKTGQSHPFIHDVEAPVYKKGNVVFVELVRSYLKMPKDTAGKKIPLKMSLDTAHISFIIEKDGTLTNAEFVGNNLPELTKALKDALAKCGGWFPRTYYGMLLRSQIIMPYKEISGYHGGTSYVREIHWREKVLGF